MHTLLSRVVTVGAVTFLAVASFQHAPAALADSRIRAASAPIPITRATMRRSLVAPAIRYSIKALPALPAQYSQLDAPEAFNEAGDIVGQAQAVKRPGYYDCLAWTGSAFVDFATADSLNCYPSSGISEANAKTGAFVSVGYTFVPTQPMNVAYYATIQGKTVKQIDYSVNYGSWLNGVNASGLATGYTFYSPFGGFSYPDPAVYTAGAADLSLAQPQCTTAIYKCMQSPYITNGNYGKARNINSHGMVFGLALNASRGQYVETTAGNPRASIQFSLPVDHGNGPNSVIGIDDAGAVLYSEFDSPTGKYYSYEYSPVTRTNRRLEVVPGSTCAEFFPIWITGAGRVLGYATDCSVGADNVYWTWDPKNKTVSVNAGLPFPSAYSTIRAYMLDDKGQILVDLFPLAGGYRWGTLNPVP